MLGETADVSLVNFARVPAHQLITIPESVSFAEAASLPGVYKTAHRMMVARGQVCGDDSVLILGASGEVGTGGLILIKNRGAVVIACGSSEANL